MFVTRGYKNSLFFVFDFLIYIKKSNEIRILVHIKEISEKRTRRIFNNILILTFSLLLQIFRYNVYKCTYDVNKRINIIKYNGSSRHDDAAQSKYIIEM